MKVKIHGAGKPINSEQKFRDGMGGYIFGTYDEAREYFQIKHKSASIIITCSPRNQQS